MKMRKMLAVLLALCLALTVMSVPAFAAADGASGVIVPSDPGESELSSLVLMGDFIRFDYKKNGTVYADSTGVYEDAEQGQTLRQLGYSQISTPVYWDGTRPFEGWIAESLQTVTDTYGNPIYSAMMPIDGKLLTGNQVLDYPAAGDQIAFRAKFAGKNEDYETYFGFDTMGGSIQVDRPGSAYGGAIYHVLCKENGQKIGEQLSLSVTEPVRSGYTFEGWMMAPMFSDTARRGRMNLYKSHELKSTLYTTAQVLSRTVPAEDTVFIAKWKEIPMDEYRYGSPESEEQPVSYNRLIVDGNGGQVSNFWFNGEPIFQDYSSFLSDKERSFYDYWEQEINPEVPCDFTAKKDDAEFLGWTVYRTDLRAYDLFCDTADFTIDDPNYLCCVDSYAYTDDITGAPYYSVQVFTNPVEVPGVTTIKEAMQLGGPYCYYVKANWSDEPQAEPVKIVTQPKTAYAKCGEKAKVTVGAEGDGLTYQWYIKNAGAAKYSKSSVTSSTYSVTMSDTVKDRLVYCIVKDQYGNEERTKTVRLRMAVTVTTQPKTTYAKSGAKAKVTVAAVGDGLTYQWYIKNAGAAKYSKSSVTSSTYSVTMSSSSKDRLVYCIVKDQYGNEERTKTVRLRMAATITTQPKSVTVSEGSSAKVTLKAVGDGLTYTWYYKDAGASKFSKTTSFTGTSYSVKMTQARSGRQVYCVVTDQYGKKAKSDIVTLNMA